MSPEAVAALLGLLALIAWVVSRPLLRRDADAAVDQRRAELEAAKEAKYREIHDAELDLHMGKLSEADHAVLDRELRGQAMDILRKIDELDADPSR